MLPSRFIIQTVNVMFGITRDGKLKNSEWRTPILPADNQNIILFNSIFLSSLELFPGKKPPQGLRNSVKETQKSRKEEF